MKKIFIIFNLLFLLLGTNIVFADITDTNVFSDFVKENESEWLFGDGNLDFADSIKTEKIIDGLTLMPGLSVEYLVGDILMVMPIFQKMEQRIRVL